MTTHTPAGGYRVGEDDDPIAIAAELNSLVRDVHSIVRPIREALPPSLDLVHVIVDQAFKRCASRLLHAHRAHLPHLGIIEVVTTRHGSNLTIHYHAAATLVDRITPDPANGAHRR